MLLENVLSHSSFYQHTARGNLPAPFAEQFMWKLCWHPLGKLAKVADPAFSIAGLS